MKQFLKYMFATIFGFFFSMLIVVLILLGMVGAASSQKDYSPSIKPNSVYELDLEGVLIDRSPDDNFSQTVSTVLGNNAQKELGLDDILKNIEKAKNDSNIIGIYLKTESFVAGFASVKEIRDALIDFKKSGKKIVAYSDTYTQKMYYLVSVADKILLNPQGMLEFKGLSTQTMFLKKTLDKLGIDMQIIRVGTYKSAVEPYTCTQMSDSNKLQVNAYVNSIWNTTLKEISQSRKISVEDLNLYADEMLMFQPTEKAIQYKLVDSLVYVDQIENIIKSVLEIDKSDDIIYLKHSSLSKIHSDQKQNQDEIAVLYAIGEIDYPGEDGIQSKEIIKTIDELANDKNVKSVVLRVNSPGGSAYGSEQIWRALSLLKTKKPLIVSMGDLAASGGYYISCLGDKIVAQPNTITGSIGIFGMIPNISGLNEKIGLSYDGVKTNKMSDAISINRKFTPDEKDLMQAYVNRGYELFVKRCAEGRKMTIDNIKLIAQGRVWTGEAALRNGLIDKIGGLNDAIIIAAKKAKIKNYSVIEYPAKEDFMKKLMKGLSEDAETRLLKVQLGENFESFKQIRNIKKINGIQARMSYDLVIN